MPTLDFKGKQFVYAHHLTVPFRGLVADKNKSMPNGDAPNMDDNLIINGDNLHALKALLPGNEGWCYNDKVNSPTMKEWLKKDANPVDKDDLERHDKWLCMMWPRLQLLKELLTEDGVIFISIDDNELSNLLALSQEIFGEENYHGLITWVKKSKPVNMGEARYKLQPKIEYVLVLAKKSPSEISRFNLYEGKERLYDKKGHKGLCRLDEVVQRKNSGSMKRDTMVYELLGISPKEGYRWQLSAKKRDAYLSQNKIVRQGNRLFIEIYPEDEDSTAFEPFWSHLEEVGTAEDGKIQLSEVLGSGHNFETVKPVNLINRLLFYATSNDDIILDSFAGSGTTAHATLALNKEDGGNRKFILVECEDYADTVTAERVRRVIKGVPTAKDDALKQGLGGTFSYYTLGEEINIETLLKGDQLPTYDELARHAFYTATGQTLDKVGSGANYYVGETDSYRVHVVYKDDVNFLKSGESALNMPLAESIAAERNGKTALVFASHKFMSQKALSEMGVTFCQLPYAMHRIMEG